MNIEQENNKNCSIFIHLFISFLCIELAYACVNVRNVSLCIYLERQMGQKSDKKPTTIPTAHQSNAGQPPFCCTPTNIPTLAYRRSAARVHYIVLMHAYHRSNARLPSFCCMPITDLLHVYERSNAPVHDY